MVECRITRPHLSGDGAEAGIDEAHIFGNRSSGQRRDNGGNLKAAVGENFA